MWKQHFRVKLFQIYVPRKDVHRDRTAWNARKAIPGGEAAWHCSSSYLGMLQGFIRADVICHVSATWAVPKCASSFVTLEACVPSLWSKSMAKAQESGARAQSTLQRLWDKPPDAKHLIGLITLIMFAIFVLGFGGLIVALIALVVGTPLLLLYSPVLVPAWVVLFFVASGVLSFSGVSIATLSLGAWTYKYIKGRRPVGSDRIEAAAHQLQDAATHAKERALDAASHVKEDLNNYMEHKRA